MGAWIWAHNHKKEKKRDVMPPENGAPMDPPKIVVSPSRAPQPSARVDYQVAWPIDLLPNRFRLLGRSSRHLV